MKLSTVCLGLLGVATLALGVATVAAAHRVNLAELPCEPAPERAAPATPQVPPHAARRPPEREVAGRSPQHRAVIEAKQAAEREASRLRALPELSRRRAEAEGAALPDDRFQVFSVEELAALTDRAQRYADRLGDLASELGRAAGGELDTARTIAELERQASLRRDFLRELDGKQVMWLFENGFFETDPARERAPSLLGTFKGERTADKHEVARDKPGDAEG